MDSGDATERRSADSAAPSDPPLDVTNLEEATAHLLSRTRRQAAELSRMIARLEQLQGDIHRHQETLGTSLVPSDEPVRPARGR